MSQATKTCVYEVSLYQYMDKGEESPEKEEQFRTQWENQARTLLAITGEEDVAILLGNQLARKLDQDRTLAVWDGGCRSISVRVTKIVSGQVPKMLLRLSSFKDNAVGELLRTDPTGTEVPHFESVLF